MESPGRSPVGFNRSNLQHDKFVPLNAIELGFSSTEANLPETQSESAARNPEEQRAKSLGAFLDTAWNAKPGNELILALRVAFQETPRAVFESLCIPDFVNRIF